MEKQAVFKSSLIGGFSKKDVLAYIDEVTQQAKKAEASLNEQITALTNDKNDLTTKLTESEQKVTDLVNQLTNQNKKAEDLSAEIERQKSALAERDREIQIQFERNRQLQFKNESLEYKSKKYEEASMQIGDAIIEAKAEAEVIIGKAKSDSDAIRLEADKSVREICNKIISVKSDIESLKTSIQSAVSLIDQKVNEIYSAIEETELKLLIEEETEATSSEEFFREAAE